MIVSDFNVLFIFVVNVTCTKLVMVLSNCAVILKHLNFLADRNLKIDSYNLLWPPEYLSQSSS